VADTHAGTPLQAPAGGRGVGGGSGRVARPLTAALLIGVALPVVALVGQGAAGARELRLAPTGTLEGSQPAVATRAPAAAPDGARTLDPDASAVHLPMVAQALAAARRELAEFDRDQAGLPPGADPSDTPDDQDRGVLPDWRAWRPGAQQDARLRVRRPGDGDPAAGSSATGPPSGSTPAAAVTAARTPEELRRRLEEIGAELDKLRAQRQQELDLPAATGSLQRVVEIMEQEEALLDESVEVRFLLELDGMTPQEIWRRGQEIQRRLDDLDERWRREILGVDRPGGVPSEHPPVYLAPVMKLLQDQYAHVRSRVPVSPELRRPRAELLGHAATLEAQIAALQAQREAELGGKDITGELMDSWWAYERQIRALRREHGETRSILQSMTPLEDPEAVIDPFPAPQGRQQDSLLEPSGTPAGATAQAASEQDPVPAPVPPSEVAEATPDHDPGSSGGQARGDPPGGDALTGDALTGDALTGDASTGGDAFGGDGVVESGVVDASNRVFDNSPFTGLDATDPGTPVGGGLFGGDGAAAAG
jgi:hypothetical protein